ncbi:uncharacterized protein [Brachionichthys hirsutus]|uniref:uncharacterized protein n=1 Tax=Brachionichthys hirsutus TaxID=412623 RepID=UPI003604B388
MDIALLREQYRSTKEKQRRHTQVLLFRTVSEQLSEAVNIVPVTQGLTSPWEPVTGPLPALTFDPDPMSSDPWHVHLGLHKRLFPGAMSQLTASGSSRRCSSSTDAVSSRPDEESRSESLSSSRATPPPHGNEEPDQTDPSRGDPGAESCCRSRGPLEKACPNQASISEPADGPRQDPPGGSFSSSDESAAPVACISCPHGDSSTSTSTWRGSGKFTTPSLRLTRQLSVGGLGSSSGGAYQTQNYHPFPNRKTPRISEAAKRLGMYSSF